MSRFLIINTITALLLAIDPAYASDGAGPGVTFINYYYLILSALGMDPHHIEEWMPVLGGLFSLAVIIAVGLKFKRSVANFEQSMIPSGSFTLVTLMEMIIDFIYDLAKDVIGKEQFQKFLPLLCGIFGFILASNLSGLVPGFSPATESINTNLAMGITVFLLYNAAGIKEHGLNYFKQFLGPIWWLMPLLFFIELVSHLARPISLSLRLYGNLFGDHLVLSVFTGLSYLVLPAFLLFFGLLVACLQSFVFTLLSSIYITMAISHDH